MIEEEIGQLPLRPRARIIKTIGEELISNEIVAILELVKNGYDAQAKRVDIIFEEPLSKNEGAILIKDDGSGMTIETIKNAWMEPATNYKQLLRKRKNKRKLLGEKGVGRFAAAKLAKKMVLFTKTISDDREIKVTFNWDDFNNDEKYLDEIKCQWEIRDPKLINKNGTIILLRELKSSWNDKKFKNLRIALSRLTNPFTPIKDFKIKLLLPKKFSKSSGIITPPPSLSHPDYKISGSVNNDGTAKMQYFSKELNINKEIIRDIKLRIPGEKPYNPRCGFFNFEFRVWNREADSLKKLADETGSKLQDVKRDLNEACGISIYRDKFRVLPYGEPDNDWLRLNLRRVQNPTVRLSNNQLVGYISFSLDENPNLTDQSNREGIVDSPEFSDIKLCVKEILNEVEIERRKERIKEKSSEKKDTKTLFESFDISSIKEITKRKIPEDKELEEAIAVTEKQMNAGVTKVREVLARYRRLSTLGQLIDIILHDGNEFLGKGLNEIQLLEMEFEKKVAQRKDIQKRIKFIKEQLQVIKTLFMRIEPFGGRKRGLPKRFILEEAIRNIFEIHINDIEKNNISFTIPQTETLVKLDQSEIQIIIMNLLTNSLYWLNNEDIDEKQIIVKIETEGGDLHLIFSDNGPGIAEEDIPYIFDPYFTRKSDGIGLGLTIIGELVTEYNGTLELLADGPLDGATFQLTFNRGI